MPARQKNTMVSATSATNWIRRLTHAGPRRLTGVTSKGLCQGEGGGEALVAVFVDEDGEQDAFHGGLVLEGAHGPGAPADLAEAALDRVGGAHRSAGRECRGRPWAARRAGPNRHPRTASPGAPRSTRDGSDRRGTVPIAQRSRRWRAESR